MTERTNTKTTPVAAAKAAILEKSLCELLDRVVPEIQAGRVSSLVVDDTSARAVGLFLHRGASLLDCRVPIVFVCPPGPGRDGSRPNADIADVHAALLGDAPLVVTEVIYSGAAVGSIVRALNARGKVPAIASLSGFLVRDESEPHSFDLVVSHRGVKLAGKFSKILMPDSLSYDAQLLLSADKTLAGVARESANSSIVRPVSGATDDPNVKLEVSAFRGELYRLAAKAARARKE